MSLVMDNERCPSNEQLSSTRVLIGQEKSGEIINAYLDIKDNEEETSHSEEDDNLLVNETFEELRLIYVLKPSKEQVLSQKFTQLSTTITEKASFVPAITHKKKVTRCNLSNDHWNQIFKLIPNYKRLSPSQFKDMLIKVIHPGSYRQIEEYLNNFLTLKFIKQRTELMSIVLQLKIEKDYWNYITNLMTTPIVIWLSEISKDMTKQNSINWDHTKTQVNIQHRQQIIENKLQQAECNLNVHLQKAYPFYCEVKNSNTTEHFIHIISNALVIFIENSLYYLRTNFEQKKILLQFDLNDAHLVKSFYDLNPTEDQISTVQKIWRTQLKSCKRAIRQKKTNKYPSSIINDQTPFERNNDDLNQQNHLVSNEPFTPAMSTIIQVRLTNIQQRAQQLINFINIIDDHNFF